jgi:N-ethylmaleimide reductase
VDGWKKVTQAVHEGGGKIFCQLWHMGLVTYPSFHGLQPIAPSSIVANGDGIIGKDLEVHPYEAPREVDAGEIKKMVQEWRHAAQCAKDAG